MCICRLVECFVWTRVIRARNMDKPGFDDSRIAFDIKQGAHLRWSRDRSLVNWDELVHNQRRANAISAEAMRQFSVRSRDVLMNAQWPHKCLPHVAWGDQNSAHVCPCACHKRVLIMGYKLSHPTALLYTGPSYMQ